MTTAKIADLQSDEEIGRACGCDPMRIRSYAESLDQASYYEILRIAKKRRPGTYRIVFSARETWLAQFHRSMAMITVNSFSFGNHVQGFIRKRSTYSNAKQHLGARVLLRADISTFFDRIQMDQVRNAFLTCGCPVPVADLLAKSCTIDGFLRQGTRCAPAIANLVCRPLDSDLLAIAAALGAQYTRYADDLTFSGRTVPSAAAVDQLVKQHGFELRDGRCILQRQGRDQFVTGLCIADPTKPRLPRRMKRRLRLVFHYIEKHGLQRHASANGRSASSEAGALTGLLRYVHSVEPELAAKWWDILNAQV